MTRAKWMRPPSASRTSTARLSDRLEMNGNGRPESTASGVSTGNSSSVKTSFSSSRCASVELVPALDLDAGPGQRGHHVVDEQACVALRQRLRPWPRSRPAAPSVSARRPIWSRPPPRPVASGRPRAPCENSSRLPAKMARNFARSSTGASVSSASASTRALKSSHDSSRFRKRSAERAVGCGARSGRLGAGAAVAPAPVFPAPAPCSATVPRPCLWLVGCADKSLRRLSDDRWLRQRRLVKNR